MLKYPTNKETGEFDYDKAPALRVKIPFWEGKFNVEIYDDQQNPLYQNNEGIMPPELITKASNIATVIECGGIWFANGKFGVTWRLIQAVVKPRDTLKGKCFIKLSSAEEAKLGETKDEAVASSGFS